MRPKRSSSHVRVLRSASKPRVVCPPSQKCSSSAVGVGGKSGYPKEDPSLSPPSPNFLESPEPARSSSKVYKLRSATKPPAMYPPQTKRRTSAVASKGKSDRRPPGALPGPLLDPPVNLAILRGHLPNSAPSKEIGNLSGGVLCAPPSCTAAKTPSQLETFSFDKIDVPNEAWLWNDPLDPWIDAVRNEEMSSGFYFNCFPGSHFEKYRKELEEARAAEMVKKGKKVPDLRKAWFWTDPFPDDEWEDETEDFPGSDVDKHKQK